MNHPTAISDTWAGPVAIWAYSALQWFMQDMSPLNLMVTGGALVWTVIKAANELTRRRILARVEQEQTDPGSGYRGPYRRSTDAIHNINTGPGGLTK